jgi:hypothetical protein
MNTEQFHIWTSADLIDTLKRTFQAHNKDDEAHSDALWVDDRYRFYRSEFADGVPAAGFLAFDSLPGGEQAAPVYLDVHYAQLKMMAAHGWRTLWYNPGCAIAPDCIPVHDGELATLDALDQVPLLLAKPTLSQCYDWLDAWYLPGNIRRHAELVGWMAYVLGVLLREQGVHLDPILAHRGGLLHDLDKLHTLDHAQPHGEMGAAYLSQQGHPDLARIVSGHVMRTALQADNASPTWETRLVFFCDKLAEEDRIVPFDVRLQALKNRYPGFRGLMDRAAPFVWGVSEEICSILSIPSHENLINRLLELQNS